MISIGPAGTFKAPVTAPEPMTMPSLFSIDAVKRYNRNAGQHFFEPSTMRFFSSRVGQKTYPSHDGTGTYFVTSEQFDYQSPRLYSVRKITADGSIDTIGDFQQYRTLTAAKREAARLSKGH